MIGLKKYWPLLLTLAITPFSSSIDLGITRYFYAFSSPSSAHFISNKYLDLIFDYGPLPAFAVAIGAVCVLLGSYFFQSFKKWRAAAALLVLTMAIGSGLIVHTLLKDHWGRPRPKQVIEFGGIQEFRPYYKPNFFHQVQPSKSFPCGHCSMGFYFFALAIVGWRMHKRWLYILGMILAWTLGITLSFLRLAQGGHFFTDLLFSALIMWYTAYLLDLLLNKD